MQFITNKIKHLFILFRIEKSLISNNGIFVNDLLLHIIMYRQISAGKLEKGNKVGYTCKSPDI